jgi:hypothetical protein
MEAFIGVEDHLIARGVLNSDFMFYVLRKR